MFDLDTCNYNKKKVAIYTRVSTEHEEQIYAMANQKDWYSAILNIHPEWDVVQMYADEGVTGTAAYKRKAFMEMIRDAYDGKFDMITKTQGMEGHRDREQGNLYRKKDW